MQLPLLRCLHDASTQAGGVSPAEGADMTSRELSGTTAVVTGASRGLGRGIAIALSQAGVQVVGVARDRARLEELREQLGEAFTPVVADATDPAAAGQLLDKHRPRPLVLNAGPAPPPRPVQQQPSPTVSRDWEGDEL